MLRNDQALEQYGLRCDEVFVLYEIPIGRAIELYRDGGYVPVAGYDCMARVNNALLIETDLITQARVATVEQLVAVRDWIARPADAADDG